MDQLRASSSIAMENQYGQSQSFDKGPKNFMTSSQNDFGKKGSLPVNNSRRRQAGQILLNEEQKGPNKAKKDEIMPQLVNMSGTKP